jgi:protein involved in polysaccharide export with SLBB domain
MSFIKYKSFVDRAYKMVGWALPTSLNNGVHCTTYILIPLAVLSICLAGCGDNVHLPTSQELIEFEKAGPVPPSIDMDRIVRAKIGGGPYHVVIGDALELTMPDIVRFITAKDLGVNNTVTPYISRVNENGDITLPIVGDIKAAGRTLSQIESDIINAYYPKHVVTRPSVFARVLEYRTARVSITGAVKTPGIYYLRSDQMSLVALIMEAGGIIDQGAASIRIIHSDQAALSNDIAVIKTAAESFEAPKRDFWRLGNPSQGTTGPSQISPIKPATDKVAPNENEIPPFFQQAYSSSAIGALALKQSDKNRPNGHPNTTNNSQKPLLVDRLIWEEPLVSTPDTEQELFLKAEPARYDNPKSNLGNAVTGIKTKSNPEINTHNSQLGAKADELFRQNAAQTLINNKLQRAQRITDTSGPQKSESLVLPVKDFNVPFADVELQDGDSVVVERLQPLLCTVMGLVNRPDNFPYPPDVRYTLTQAIGFGGGLNLVADPRYATIYRLKRDGSCVSATFPIRGSAKQADASNISIKPGDIIAVERTPRTQTALFLDRIFRINVGTYWSLNNNNQY